ncbi:esterase-like activity of phytase family protein [Sphingomonas sp. EC-HK361]|uniref:esterase-like activity of phytase family protein n=1 Tax=Sphingomonas sp. EC-HK361 TaxID=2038397 RepID=UPI001F373299|nr:esterase-like activity of phytase family protein [Sphingomonas sp. EC-HK361]
MIALCQIVLPGWSGEERLALLDVDHPNISAVRVLLDAGDPDRKRAGALEYLGGVSLTSRDPAFGGFSSLSVVGDRITLLSDGGNVASFRLNREMQPRAIRFANLPAGPGRGWDKRDRDSESMAVDTATGRVFVGFEGYNMIWRYAPDFARAERAIAPAAMAKWPANGGAETLARMPDGRFVVISEVAHVAPAHWVGNDAGRLKTRDGLIFASDPTTPGLQPLHFAYTPPGRFDTSDATALPNGDLLVLDRDFRLPYHFSAMVSRVRARDLHPGAVTHPERLALLDSPLLHDNFEGIATSREGDDTIVWIVSDDNQSWLQRTLLLKFRLRG